MGLLRTLWILLRHWVSGRSYIRIIGSGQFKSCPTARVSKSKIYVYPGTSLIIGQNCNIRNAHISVTKGSCKIADNTIIDGATISIDNGELIVGHHSKISCKRIWIRFGGVLTLGDYTNINDGSEIRCDERVTIGSFNQISYNVRIWDTNTHSILPAEERRRIAIAKFPYFGYEESRPKTSPVVIGNDCWIGENATILKGSQIEDECIVGFGTFIAGSNIPKRTTAVNKRQLFTREH